MSHSVQVITSGKSLTAVPVYPGSTAPITIQGATGPAGPAAPEGPVAPRIVIGAVLPG